VLSVEDEILIESSGNVKGLLLEDC